MKQTVFYLWREPKAAEGFAAGVSLHSHTNQSQETLDFIAELSTDWRVLQPIIRWGERKCLRTTGIQPDYARSYWTPPLTPKLAYDLERNQIENKLQLPAMVSLTDHDDIQAPLLLRALPSARGIPVSVEWTMPFGPKDVRTAFHLGIHNLPSATGVDWMQRLAAFTANQLESLGDILAELDEIPGVLIVFNHPLWDLYRIGLEKHRFYVNEFLALYGQYVHAIELNGLRNWEENAEAARLAGQWNQLLISGGDRHGIEPNANVNLTRATSFTEFVYQIRRERESHVLFMPQYADPWKQRILNSTLDAIRDYPDFPQGSQRWDDRVFHPDAKGAMRSLSTLWRRGAPPKVVGSVLGIMRMLGTFPVSSGLRLAWSDTNSMPLWLSARPSHARCYEYLVRRLGKEA